MRSLLVVVCGAIAFQDKSVIIDYDYNSLLLILRNLLMITVNQNLNNNDLLALVKKVETEGERIIIETENKGKVAIINYADLQQLEDARDCAELRQAIAESSGEFYTLDQVLAERGLTLEDIMSEEDE